MNMKKILLLSAFISLIFLQKANSQTVTCTGINNWSSGQAYNGNDAVVYQGIKYVACYWTQGNQPDLNSSPTCSGNYWKVGGTCQNPVTPNYVSCIGISSWNSATAYNANAQVAFSGNVYTANWYTQNQQPGQGTDWSLLGVCLNSSLNVIGSITPFNGYVGSTSDAQSVSISGSNLGGNVTITAPSNFEVSLSSTSGFSNSITITVGTIPATLATTTIYVHYVPSVSGTSSGNITISSMGLPSQNVAVTGTATADWVVSGNNNMYNANPGNIGIGISNPLYKLDVNGDFRVTGKMHIGPSSLVLDGNPGNGTGNEIYNNVNNGSVLIQSNSGVTAGNTIINATDGNVGIGTSNPLSKLHVNGGIYMEDASLGGGGGNALTLGNDIGQGLFYFKRFNNNSINRSELDLFIGNMTANNKFVIYGVGGDFNPAILTVYTKQGGQILIGGEDQYQPTNHTDYKLAVAGKLVSQKAVVTAPNFWSDFVFDPKYKLPTLNETELFIKKYKHLPSIPSETEVKGKGIDVAEMDALLLQKIEELYLHLIEMQKENAAQKTEMEKLKKTIEEIKSKN